MTRSTVPSRVLVPAAVALSVLVPVSASASASPRPEAPVTSVIVTGAPADAALRADIAATPVGTTRTVVTPAYVRTITRVTATCSRGIDAYTPVLVLLDNGIAANGMGVFHNTGCSGTVAGSVYLWKGSKNVSSTIGKLVPAGATMTINTYYHCGGSTYQNYHTAVGFGLSNGQESGSHTMMCS